jgi:hypothetical protein
VADLADLPDVASDAVADSGPDVASEAGDDPDADADSDDATDTATDAATDAAFEDASDPGVETVSDPGPSAPVLATLPAESVIALLAVHASGALADAGVRVPLSELQDVTLRADNAEALAVTGLGPDTPKHLVAIGLALDGASAAATGDVLLGDQNSPSRVVYTGADEALVAMRGPLPSFLVTVRRQADGTWEKGPETPCGEGPVGLYPLPQDGHALLLRSDAFAEGTDCEVVPIARGADGGWAAEGAGVRFDEDVYHLALHPSGARAWAPLTGALAVDGGISHYGRILPLVPAAAPSKDWVEALPATDTGRAGSTIRVSRDGRTLAVLAQNGTVNPQTGQEIYDRFEVVTIDVDAAGVATAPAGPRNPLPLSMSTSFAFDPWGRLLLDSADKAACPSGHGLRTHARSGTLWTAAEGAAACLEAQPGTLVVGTVP